MNLHPTRQDTLPEPIWYDYALDGNGARFKNSPPSLFGDRKCQQLSLLPNDSHSLASDPLQEQPDNHDDGDTEASYTTRSLLDNADSNCTRKHVSPEFSKSQIVDLKPYVVERDTELSPNSSDTASLSTCPFSSPSSLMILVCAADEDTIIPAMAAAMDHNSTVLHCQGIIVTGIAYSTANETCRIFVGWEDDSGSQHIRVSLLYWSLDRSSVDPARAHYYRRRYQVRLPVTEDVNLETATEVFDLRSHHHIPAFMRFASQVCSYGGQIASSLPVNDLPNTDKIRSSSQHSNHRGDRLYTKVTTWAAQVRPSDLSVFIYIPVVLS